ncbi:sigma-70 family RNA polymerase sigma factor [Solirubrobacter ginsenosidimutans]|uniref:Sigma-70 family RNA polymerase sigma factor n=2 Tax=Solirubrobacter ginsenosidimutans TaxID=490573 RepID=A0A9X3MV20_9ACTN|nr:sigma-70 family RNA polymerase sigma factor [Solirubrobacter ginsenosidimutans]
MPGHSNSHTQTWSADPQRLRKEHDLFAQLAVDPTMRAALVERFMPLARQLARRYEHSREDLDDLEQVAAIGLIKAIDRFDPERGLAFTSFAFPTILGELKRHFRDRSWSVRVPRPLQERVSRIDALTAELSGELGRSPTVTEIAARSATTTEEVIETLQAAKARHATSFDRPRNDNGETYDVAFVDPGFERAENAADLEHLMGVLGERERLILRLRFREDRLQSQIAEMTGVSQMHVSRLITRSIERLHEASQQPASAA